MALKVTEASGTKNEFPDTHNRVIGYIHPSGSLLILTELRDESNLVSGYTNQYAYAPAAWVDASGEFVHDTPESLASKIL